MSKFAPLGVEIDTSDIEVPLVKKRKLHRSDGEPVRKGSSSKAPTSSSKSKLPVQSSPSHAADPTSVPAHPSVNTPLRTGTSETSPSGSAARLPQATPPPQSQEPIFHGETNVPEAPRFRKSMDTSRLPRWLPKFDHSHGAPFTTETSLFYDQTDALTFIKGMRTPRDEDVLSKKGELTRHRQGQFHLMKALLLFSKNDDIMEKAHRRICELGKESADRGDAIVELIKEKEGLVQENTALKVAVSEQEKLRADFRRSENELKKSTTVVASLNSKVGELEEEASGTAAAMALKDKKLERLAQEIAALNELALQVAKDNEASLEEARAYYREEAKSKGIELFKQGLDKGYQRCLDEYGFDDDSTACLVQEVEDEGAAPPACPTSVPPVAELAIPEGSVSEPSLADPALPSEVAVELISDPPTAP